MQPKQATTLQEMQEYSALSADSISYIEAMYERYLTDKTSLSNDWINYFEDKFVKLDPTHDDQPHATIKEQFLLRARNSNRSAPMKQSSVSTKYEKRQVGVVQLIAGYRNRGHQNANLDPLGIAKRETVPDLDLATHGLTKSDYDTVFQTGNLAIGKKEATLKEMVEAMDRIYCGSIGAEYMHIVDTKEKRWIQNYLESESGNISKKFSKEEKKHILDRLTAAEGIESYLARKFTGAKRFGLEGGESFIPMVDELVQRSGTMGTKEVVIGMAHRGRLNLLINILGKNPTDLFDEFQGKTFHKKGSGDVKYHSGYSSNLMTPGGEIHLSLAFNPSHLEIVSPVVEGSVRARQIRRGEIGQQVLPIIVHGDAAFAGQGVVMETFQMSQTRGFRTGGTVHIVINNQVGFTTSNPADSRSTEYCTDIAKMVQAPIFHVNGDDPEAVIFITQLAADYRKEFQRDVVIDLYCYRRRGHNEADEPSVTQPLMYTEIKAHASTRTLYTDQLIAENVVSRVDADSMAADYRTALDKGEHVANALVSDPNRNLYVDWSPYLGHDLVDDWHTGVPLEKLKEYGQKIANTPDGFVMQRQVARTMQERLQMQTGEAPLNWGAAETLAYASLLDEDYLVRITGQDVGRGTFSHRHAVLYDQNTGQRHVPLRHINDNQERFAIYDSLLSEEAVLAYEYGYATTYPTSLIVWEAQFGDFVNGAQVVIDQFISSGETKWERLCGLTMLLPHGFEGQGPEHSSARLERFLQSCAENNMQVVVPTTPAQIFHLLRRQAVRPSRVPLIVMSPKSLLRHRLATSTLQELSEGGFKTVIGEQDDINPQDVTRIVLCSGKVYYDLLAKRREQELKHVAIFRIEQLYPFPEDKMVDLFNDYTNATSLVWCQEEPLNQGAWTYIAPKLYLSIKNISSKIVFTQPSARAAAAAPACGSLAVHTAQQNKLVNDALGLKDEEPAS